MRVEGRNAVRELILSGETIDRVLIADGNHDAVINEIISLLKMINLQW